MSASTLIRRLSRDPVLRRDAFRCQYCGCDLLADVDSLATFARDHIQPQGRGGPDHHSNRVACCRLCDRLKSGRPAASVDEGKRIIAEQHATWAEALARLREIFRPELADPEVQVTIADDVNGTTVKFRVDGTVKEVRQNCFPVCQARQWLQWYGCESDKPIACCVSELESEIVVRWFPTTDDLDAARAAMDMLSDGEWGIYT